MTARGERLGTKWYGHPGGRRTSRAFLCSYGVAEELAQRVGMHYDEVHDLLIELGKVMQDRLMRGEPCGIPHLLTLYIHERKFELTQARIDHAKNLAQAQGHAIKHHIMPHTRYIRDVRMHFARDIKAMIAKEAIYTKPFDAHVEDIRRRLKVPKAKRHYRHPKGKVHGKTE